MHKNHGKGGGKNHVATTSNSHKVNLVERKISPVNKAAASARTDAKKENPPKDKGVSQKKDVNINSYIQTFKKTEILSRSSRKDKHSPCIVMPIEWYEKMERRINWKPETSGLLIYRAGKENEAIVEFAIETGTGQENGESVTPNPLKKQKFLRMIKDNPKVGYIEYHTHTKNTCENFGELYSRSFSTPDLKYLAVAVNSDQKYKHVLFTPSHVITFGLLKPKFCITRDTTLFKEQWKTWERKWQAAK